MVEQSLKYFEDRISSSLKPNGQDLRAVFSSETTKSLFLDFLTRSECRCLFASCHLDGSLNVFTNPASFSGGKCVTFFKCRHVSKLRLETMVDDVLYLEHSEQLLNDLWLLSREVYLPLVCISGAEEHHVLDRLLDSMHCLIAATEVLSNHAKKQVVLPLPSLEVLSDVSSYPNRHAGVMHVLETSVVMWLKQIKLALVCDPLAYVNRDPFPGPLEEREFWATRLKALSSVREQLSSLLAMTILTNLEEAHSSYAGVFGQVYKDVDMAIADCQHILIFLNTLHPWIVNLKNSDTVAAILQNIPPFLHTFYLIVSNSRYYGNTTTNLERLLNLMSNEVVMASKKFLPNEFLLDPEEYLDGISCALRVCASFRGAFLDYKDKYDAQLRHNHEELMQGRDGSPSEHAVVMSRVAWPMWTSPVFSAINAFMERLNDLHEVVSTYIHFRELRPLNAGTHQCASIHPNQPVIFAEFEKILEHLLQSQTDMLQLNQSGAFEANFFEFRREVKVLERQVSHLLCDLWDRSSTPLSQFRILELYKGLSSREEVQARLSGRCSDLLQELTSNVLQAEKVLQCFIASPSLKKVMPPTASALFWLQGFQRRLEGTAKQCEHFSVTLLGTEDGWTLRNLQSNLMEQVLRLQKSRVCEWKLALPSSIRQCLEEPVLTRLPGKELAVNINPEFLLALKEVKYISQTSFADSIPEALLSAKTECERVDLYSKLSRLTVMVQEYNTIRRPLTETEAALFQHRMIRMETLLEDGITKIPWLSKDLEDFISVTSVLICGDFSPRMRKLRDLQHQIHSTIASWRTLSDGDAFNSATGTGVPSLEELSTQQQFACEKLEVLLSSGVNKIDQLVHECFSLVDAGGDSPVWSSCMHQIDASVLCGLKNAFMSAVGSLLRRVELYEQGHTIQPLMSVKVELLGGDVAFVPALDSQMSDKSIPEIVRRWLSTLLETCGRVRLNRGTQKGQERRYLSTLQVDPDVTSAMSKVIAHLESSARHCQSLKNKFLSFSFVWEQDVEESFDLFLKGKYASRGHRLTGPQTVRASAWSSHGRSASARPATATTVLSGTMGISDWTFIFPESGDEVSEDTELNLPTLDDFDLQIAVFEGFAEKLSKIDDFLVVGWLKIDSRPIKHALQSYVSKWKYRFTSYLADRICNVLESLDVFLAEVEPSVDSVTGSEDDWEQIRQIISVFNKVSTKAQEMDGRFGAVHRSVQLLEKYGHPISKDVSAFLAVAPQKWVSLKKKIGIAKQRVSPKVQANAELVNQELDEFRKTFEALLCAFQVSDCLRFSTCHEDAMMALNSIKEKLVEMREASKDLEVIQELFEKSIFSFSKLEEMDGELTSLEKLIELSRHFTAQHLDWKAHRWCNADTVLLANATALQMDQLRNLPLYCAQWDLYKKLCSAVAELQSTLPVINDLLRPSLRPRHWKQVVRLALPRRSAATKSLSPEEIKTLSLGRFMEFRLHAHAADVRLITDRADKDLAVEVAIKTFEEVWLSRVFSVCPQQQHFVMGKKLLEGSLVETAPSGRESTAPSRLPSATPGPSSHTDVTSSLINIVDDVDTVVDTVGEHQTSLQALLGTSSASSFMEDLNKWRNILQTIEAVLKLWMSVQDLWCLLREVYVSSGIKETLPGPAHAFSVVDQEYCTLVKQVEKNSNVMYQCCQEGQLSKLEKMYHSLKDCKMHLLEYTRVHQESCPWFLLLPSDDVLQFICHGSDPIFLSANINKILPPAESLLLSECAEEVTVSGIVSRDGDTLALLEGLPHSTPTDVLLSGIMEGCSAALGQSMRDCLQQMNCTSFDIHKLKSIVSWLLEDGRSNQVALTVFWAVLSSTLKVEEASTQLQSLSDLLEYATSLYSRQSPDVTGQRSPASPEHAGHPEWLPWQLTRLKCAILLIMYYRSLLLGVLSSANGQPRQDSSPPFLWALSPKFSLGSDGITPAFACGDIHLPYGFQYTGAGGRVLLTPETERCLFSLMTAVTTGSIAFCTGKEDSVKQDTLACLSESTGHTQYYLVCSRQSKLQDIRDVIKAAVLTGVWICMQGFDSLPESIAYSAVSLLCTVMDAMRKKLSTICFQKESVAVADTQFYCLLVDTQSYTPECFFSQAPLHLATQYRCINFNQPNLKFLLPAFLLGSGFVHAQKLTSDVYSVVTALPPLKTHPLTVTAGMLGGIINLAAKHKEVLVTSGSLTTLYAGAADSLHVGSETNLHKNMEGLGATEVSTSEVTSRSHSASHFKQHCEPYVEPIPDHLHATMDIVLAKAVEHSEEEKEVKTVPTEPDATSQLLEQLSLMLALKDAFLPAYGGVGTEKGKLFIALLRSVFAGLSIDKVISEEIESLQKAGSVTSHKEMLDSVRESRAVSVLGRSVSPPLKDPLTFEEAIASACRILELEPTIKFQSKIIQFIQLLQANSLVLLNGAPGCGKTSCVTVASEAMKLLGYCVQTTRISLNRGADDMGGHWDGRHWIDGILPYTLAELLSKQTIGRESTEGASPVAHWIIIDNSFCVPALLRMIHLPGMLSIPSRKCILLPPELKIIVESDLLTDVAVPLLQLCPDDVGWEAVLNAKLAKSTLPVVKKNACTVEGCFRKFLAKVFNSNFCNHSDCPHYLTVSACHLFEAAISEGRAQSDSALEAVALFATASSVKGHLKARFDGVESALRSSVNADVELPVNVSICDCYLDVDHCRFVPWHNRVQGQVHRQLVPNGPVFISTAQSAACYHILSLASDHGVPVLLRGSPGSGKTSCVLNHISKYTSNPVSDVKTLVINVTEITTASSVADRLIEHMSWTAGHTYVPLDAKKLVCILDDIHKAANSSCGQGVLNILQQHVREGGFDHPDNHQWYRMADVSFIVVADSTTELHPRFSQPFLLLDWQDYSSSDLHFILCELLRDVAVRSEATITTDEIISKVVDVALDLHKQLQQSFYSEALCRSLFSLADLTKLFCRVSSLSAKLDSVEDFLLVWQHESFWAYSSKLPSDADVARYLDTAAMAVKKHFSSVPLVGCLHIFKPHVVLPAECGSPACPLIPLTTAELLKVRKYIQEHMDEVQKVEPVAPLIFCSQLVQEICHLTEMLAGPFHHAHCLQIGHSGADSVLAVVAHIANFKVVRLTDLNSARYSHGCPSDANGYSLEHFRKDIVSICSRAGAKDEKLLVHICEEDLPDPFSLMVYLEELINNCSVTHLFTEEEKAYVINAIRSSVTHAGIDFCQDSAWVFFLRNLHKNIRVVVTVSASPPKLFQWMTKERPSLLRSMNVIHHRPWNQDNLLEVAELQLAGLGLSSSERKRLSHVLTSMHVAISDQQIGNSYMDNWTFKNFIESYARELAMLQQRNAKQCQELSESLDCIEAAESKSDSLIKCLEQELTVLEEKKYACLKILDQLGQDTAIAAEHHKLQLRLKERLSHLERMLPEYEHAYEIAVARTAQLVSDTKELVAGMNQESLFELRLQHSPPKEVEGLLSAVIVIVKSPHADLTWTKGAKRLMANLGRFAEMLNSFDEQEVPSSAVLESLSPYFEDNTLNVSYHKSLGHPEAVLQICQWVVNVMSYHQMLENKVKPLQTKLKSMKELHADLKHKLLALTDKIQSLTKRLDDMHQSLEELSVDKSLHEEHVQTVKEQLNDVSNFVQLLQEMKVHWTKELETKRDAVAHHYGSLAFVVGYAVYLAKLPHHLRKDCLQKWWPACLRSCGIELHLPQVSVGDAEFPISDAENSGDIHAVEPNGDSQAVHEASLHSLNITMYEMALNLSLHLTDVSDILHLLEQGFSTEDVLHFFIMKAPWNESVVFIDPEQQSFKLLEERHGGELQYVDGRFVDATFFSTLETAITVGQPLVIHHVCQDIDPATLAVMQQAKIASANQGLYMILHGKRLLVHPHFVLYLVTPLPLEMLQPKIVSTAIVIDFTPYKYQVLCGLGGSTLGGGQLKALLDDYHRRSTAMIKKLSQFQEASFTVDVIQDEMQSLLHIRSQTLASDIPNALRMPAQGLLSGQVPHLYAIMHVLSRGSSLVGLPLQEWINVVQGLDAESPAKQQLEALLLKGLSVGTRFLTAPLWRCLLAACRLLPAPTPNQDSREDIPIAVPDVPCSNLTSSLQDIITSFVEAPHSRPLLLVHNNKSFLSMLNRSVVVNEFKDACKATGKQCEVFNLSTEDVPAVLETLGSLPPNCCILIDTGCAEGTILAELAKQIRALSEEGCACVLVCSQQNLTWHVTCECEAVLLSNLKVASSSTRNPGEQESAAVRSPQYIFAVFLAYSLARINEQTSQPQQCKAAVFRLCALHTHLLYVATVSSGDHAPPPTTLFLMCLGQALASSTCLSTTGPEVDFKVLDYIQEVYSCYDMLLDGTTIGEYLLSEEMKVGNEVVSIPSNEASWPSEWHSDHTTLLSMLNPQEKDSGSVQLAEMVESVLSAVLS